MDLLELYDLSYTKLCILNDNTLLSAKNIKLEKKLNEIDTLSFEVPTTSPKWKHIVNENMVLWKGEYYKIKNPSIEHDENMNTTTVECKHLSCSLLDKINEEIDLIGTTPLELMTKALVGTGWAVGTIDASISKSRSLQAKEQSAFTNLVKVAELFGGYLVFHSITKTVDLYISPLDRHTIIRTGKNLKSITVEYDSSEIVTRLYPFGGQSDITDDEDINIMSVNPTGHAYIENYSYYLSLGYSQGYIDSHPELFLHEQYWKADEYKDAQSLYTDAVAKLNTICKPKTTCTVKGLDLSYLPQYFIDTPEIYEIITIIDEDIDFTLQLNVTSITKNYDNPTDMEITIENTIEYTSVLKQLSDTSKTVGGTISNGFNVKYSALKTILGEDYIITGKIWANQISAGLIKGVTIETSSVEGTYITLNEQNLLILENDPLNPTTPFQRVGIGYDDKYTVGSKITYLFFNDYSQGIFVDNDFAVFENLQGEIELMAEDLIRLTSTGDIDLEAYHDINLNTEIGQVLVNGVPLKGITDEDTVPMVEIDITDYGLSVIYADDTYGAYTITKDSQGRVNHIIAEDGTDLLINYMETLNPLAPILSSGAVNVTGLILNLTFNKVMINPTHHEGEFTVKVNGVDNPVISTYQGANSYILTLTLTTRILNTDTVTVSYDGITFKSIQSVRLAKFTDRVVTNLSLIALPTIQSATTNTAGTIVTMTFDKDMADPIGKQDEFSVGV